MTNLDSDNNDDDDDDDDNEKDDDESANENEKNDENDKTTSVNRKESAVIPAEKKSFSVLPVVTHGTKKKSEKRKAVTSLELSSLSSSSSSSSSLGEDNVPKQAAVGISEFKDVEQMNFEKYNLEDPALNITSWEEMHWTEERIASQKDLASLSDTYTISTSSSSNANNSDKKKRPLTIMRSHRYMLPERLCISFWQRHKLAIKDIEAILYEGSSSAWLFKLASIHQVLSVTRDQTCRSFVSGSNLPSHLGRSQQRRQLNSTKKEKEEVEEYHGQVCGWNYGTGKKKMINEILRVLKKRYPEFKNNPPMLQEQPKQKPAKKLKTDHSDSTDKFLNMPVYTIRNDIFSKMSSSVLAIQNALSSFRQHSPQLKTSSFASSSSSSLISDPPISSSVPSDSPLSRSSSSVVTTLTAPVELMSHSAESMELRLLKRPWKWRNIYLLPVRQKQVQNQSWLQMVRVVPWINFTKMYGTPKKLIDLPMTIHLGVNQHLFALLEEQFYFVQTTNNHTKTHTKTVK